MMKIEKWPEMYTLGGSNILRGHQDIVLSKFPKTCTKSRKFLSFYIIMIICPNELTFIQKESRGNFERV